MPGYVTGMWIMVLLTDKTSQDLQKMYVCYMYMSLWGILHEDFEQSNMATLSYP